MIVRAAAALAFGALAALPACTSEVSRESTEVSTSPSAGICKSIASRPGLSGFSITECEKSDYVSECKDGSIVYSSKGQNCSAEQGWKTDLKITDG